MLTKVDDTYAEIDLDFTKFVITEWYWAYEGRRTRLAEGEREQRRRRNGGHEHARRQMDVDIQEKLMEEVGGTDRPTSRIASTHRFDLDDAGLVWLTMKRVSVFGEDGFYQIVGGHPPIAGKKPTDDANNTSPGRPGGGVAGLAVDVTGTASTTRTMASSSGCGEEGRGHTFA